MCVSLTFSYTDGLEEYGITLSQILTRKKQKAKALDGSSKPTVCLNVTYTKTILIPLQSKFMLHYYTHLMHNMFRLKNKEP